MVFCLFLFSPPGPEPPANLQLSMSTYSSLAVEWDEPAAGRFDGYEVTYEYAANTNPQNDALGLTQSPTDVMDKKDLPRRSPSIEAISCLCSFLPHVW